MDLEFIERLLKLLSESNADEIEIEEEGKRVKVAKHPAPPPGLREVVMAPQAPTPPPPAAAASPPAETPASHHEIRSPIVGTFYRSPAPDSAPFVEVGSVVQAGAVLCIVEAMKLMNEIESDVEGKIVKVLVENGQPVEYDQPLFLIDKS
ncbi:MAG: acetyl-CoA carboxylase biotin carboxyl carrier protein [Ignavibacteria bacterium]|nr:acetyl-CoA carboxylase biotin carboxyl carrier protein [Ignavibacteria bacterium]